MIKSVLINRRTCLQGMGEGYVTVHIPTSGGTVVAQEEYTFQYLGLVGNLSGPASLGTFVFVPMDGDCIINPLNQASITSQVTFTA